MCKFNCINCIHCASIEYKVKNKVFQYNRWFEFDVDNASHTCQNVDSEFYRQEVYSLEGTEKCKFFKNKYEDIKEYVKGKKLKFNYNFPTEKQANTLKFITSITGNVFYGKYKKEASDFIDKYFKIAQEEKNKGNCKKYDASLYYNFPTEKQIKMMTFITLTIGKVFDGKSKGAAIDFIERNLDTAEEVKALK